MIKESGRVFDKKSPADVEAMKALFDKLESEEVQEDIAHLQQTINNIEAALNVIKQRDFSDMAEEELDEVAEVIENLDKFKMEMNMLVDDYLGQGALIQANLPEDMMGEPPSQFVGWGARDPSDPDFALAPPTIPLAEASFVSELIKIANELDKRGLVKEADELDVIVKESIAPLVMAAAAVVLLCGTSGCKQISKEELGELTEGDIDWEFEYDEDGNTIGVHAMGDLASQVAEQDDLSRFPMPNVSLTWPCKYWKVLRDSEFTKNILKVGENYKATVTLSWQMNDEGYIMNEEMTNAKIDNC